MYKPCLEIPKKRQKLFDSSLCIVCQKTVEKPKRGKAPKNDADSFKVFIDVCKILEEKGDTKYHHIHEVIKNKSHTDLEKEKFCFHPAPCRRDFQRILSNHERTSVAAETTKKSPVPSPKVSRQQTMSFNKDLCLFCQKDLTDECTYNLCQTSRDVVLKEAFAECPDSLALYKIRSSHAFDGMAGDIKYHRSCWRNIIDKRIPEVQMRRKTGSTSKQLNATAESAEPDEFEPDECATDTQNGECDEELPDVTLAVSEDNSDMELRNGRIVKTNDNACEVETPSTSLKEVILSQIMEGAKVELVNGRALTLNNLVEIYKSRTIEYGSTDERSDAAIRIEMHRIVNKRICEKMDGVEFQNAYAKKESQRLVTKDLRAFAEKYAEENSSLSSDAEIAILKKAATILRKRTLSFMKKNKLTIEDFKVGVGDVNQQFPPELLSFVEELLFSQRRLDVERSTERKQLTETVSSSIVFNIKTDRQVAYAGKRKTRGRHKYTPQQLMARTLAIRHCERNNSILRLLSAPHFGITLTPRESLLIETMIANAMTKIVQKEGVYVPPNMKRGVRLSFHIDNFDEQVETFDGKNTVHYLLIVGFQRRHGNFEPIELSLEKTTALTLNENSFGELLPCDEPTNRQFKRTPGCTEASCSLDYKESRSQSMFFWKFIRSFEHLLVVDEEATYVFKDIQQMSVDIIGTEHAERWNVDSLVLPSFGATNSLVTDMDTTLTNIFTLPFVAGPASSTSAVYTALDIAFRTSDVISPSTSNNNDDQTFSDETRDGNTLEMNALEPEQSIEEDGEPVAENTFTRTLEPPPLWKTIIVLDLDLYAKAYKLVNSRSDLRERYVLCLGELHIVFAGIRAIGTFINSSGIDDAWMAAEWFDSESLLRQVKECSNMKRALAAHEATLIAVNILILQEALCWFKEHNWCNEDLIQAMTIARNAIKNKDLYSGRFKDAWNQLKSYISDIKLEEKINEFVVNNKNNRLLQFLVRYSQMVTRLFTFIEATRSRNWLLHMDALEDMIADFASMDRINYRRYSATYIADMRHLRTSDKETWNYFMEGNFCCQKNEMPFTAIGRDHCGEQENKVLKGRGGVSGQSSNSNSTNRYFMTAPILAQIYSDMQKQGGGSDASRKLHHQLGKAYTQRQNKWVVSLLKTFEHHKVSLSSKEKGPFRNIVTGQVFSDAIYDDLIGAYETGQNLYKTFVDERLKPGSKIGIFAKLKKSKIKTCKQGNKAANIKYKDKFATLKEENVFISRIAMIRGSREIDMKSIIGNHEMTPVVHSLMKRDGTLLNGWDGKSDLASTTLKEANVSVIENIPFKSEVVAVDAMFIMNQISTKPIWVKTGKDIAKEFCDRVDKQSEGAEIVIIGFEWYSDDSLKTMAWKSRKSGDKTKRNDYVIEPDTDLSKRCMKDILGTTATKRSLTTLLMNAAECHLKERNVEYFIAGNGVTLTSYAAERGVTNHTEGETAIIMGLASVNLDQKRAVVYGSDVDLFVLLLAHYKNIGCLEMYMKSLSGYTSITAVYDFLGDEVASALLPFHALTGCDITGKFSGKTKEFWTKKFLSERGNDNFIQALLSLHSCQSEDVVNEIARFFCRSYCPKRTPKRVTDSLVETRYFLYKKFSSETCRLPPSPGAFLQHVKRACCPLMVWHSANMSETRVPVHLQCGWENCDGVLMPICTKDEIAPEDLITLVSCNCNGECLNNHCTCKKNNVACTDFCGCGDSCENTDMRPPENLSAEDDGEQEEDSEEDEEDEEDAEDELNEIEQFEEQEENEELE